MGGFNVRLPTGHTPIPVNYRYFKRNENMLKIRCYIQDCSRGDWFVLYQLSKNLNRPFFMDFLVTLARIIETEKNNPDRIVKSLDEGDGIMDLMLKPNLTTYESKEDDKNRDGDDDDDDDN